MKTRNIKTSFWKDTNVQNLSFVARSLFMYLLTCEHINLTGIFELPDQFILLETGMTKAQLSKAKEELVQSQRVLFFRSWVQVTNAQKHNRYHASEKNQDAFQRELDEVPEDVIKSLNEVKKHSGIDSGIYTAPIATSNQKPVTSNKYNKEFEDFWSDYPKKKAKGKAWSSWKGMSQEDRKAAKDALPNHKSSEDWKKDNGQYIPHPATWLNQRRWEDDVGQAETNDLSQLAKQFQS